MRTSTASVAPVVGTLEVLDCRYYGTLEEIFARELDRLAEAGVADPEVTSTGGNCYALTGDPGRTADGRSIHLLATTNGDPALTTDMPITSWVVGLYEDQGDSVALAMGEAAVGAHGDSRDALGCAVARACRALHQYSGAAPAGKVAHIGDGGMAWSPE